MKYNSPAVLKLSTPDFSASLLKARMMNRALIIPKMMLTATTATKLTIGNNETDDGFAVAGPILVEAIVKNEMKSTTTTTTCITTNKMAYRTFLKIFGSL